MKRWLNVTLLTLLLAACATQPAPRLKPAAAFPPPPVSVAQPVTESLHGVTVTDPYRWLEDQESPATRDWIDRQNAYTDAMLGNLPQRAALAPRIEALLNVDQITIPRVRAGRYFFTRRKAGEDLFSIYVRERADGPDILLVDAAPLSPKHTTNVGIEDVSRDGRTLAYYVREGGADEVEIHFFDVDAKKDSGPPLPRHRYEGVSVLPDRNIVYYARFTDDGTARVFRRPLFGGAEEKLFGDGYTKDKIIFTSVSDDDRWLLVHVLYGSAAKKTEVYLKDLGTDAPLKTVVNDLDFRSSADFAGDSLVIETNWNAPNERIMVVGVADPGRANWRELVPENKNAAIQGFSPAGGKVFVRYLESVKPRIVGYALDGTRQDDIAFPTLGRLEDIQGTWSTPVAFYRFSSFALPVTIYSYDVASKQSSVFARTNVPVNTDDFVLEQVFYPSKDGTQIPMFVFYKKGLVRNGTNPTFLTGYGGFNQSQTPAFLPRAVSWAENGGVYALACMRGGAEYGEAWHQAGMMAKKQNVFDDFAGAAQYLIRERYTSPEHLGIGGTSNGGLLVTASLTQHPELFKAVYCGYPLVDMLRYDKFLVGAFWVPEYGSASDPEQFRTIYAYSPYQHVVQGTEYPATLFVTGDADTRVAPLHARKMAALMQNSGSSNPVLIRYHTAGGHSGGEPLNVQVRNEAEIEAFLLSELK